KRRVETLHALEEGKNATAELADYVATRIVNCHLDTMRRLGITYDLLPRESEVLHFLWSHAFERMKSSGAIRFEEEGRNRGCWVMPMETHEGSDEGHTGGMTASNAEGANATAPHCGGGATVYNVIDTRQSYPQEVVKRGIAAVAPEVGEAASVHLSY